MWNDGSLRMIGMREKEEIINGDMFISFVLKKCIFEATVTQENNRDGFPRDHQGMNQDLKEIIENPLLLMPRSYRRFYDHLSDLKS